MEPTTTAADPELQPAGLRIPPLFDAGSAMSPRSVGLYSDQVTTMTVCSRRFSNSFVTPTATAMASGCSDGRAAGIPAPERLSMAHYTIRSGQTRLTSQRTEPAMAAPISAPVAMSLG